MLRQGSAGKARLCAVGQGVLRTGMERRGRHGKLRIVLVGLGMVRQARRVEACHGRVRHGRQGKAWCGKGRFGMVWYGRHGNIK